MRKRTKIILTGIIIFLGFWLYFGQPWAEEESSPPPGENVFEPILKSRPNLDSEAPGRVQGVGTQFAITNSEYLNLALESSVPISLIAESTPGIITFDFEANPASPAQIKLSGFKPNTQYHLFKDNYQNHQAFTTDSIGNYAYTQDLTSRHHVFILPQIMIKEINDTPGGGDCASFGSWNQLTKTCILARDLPAAISFIGDGITLDGNNHKLIGNQTGYGILIDNQNNLIIKNLTIEDFYIGLLLSRTSGNSITGNTLKNNRHSAVLLYREAKNNNFTNNLLADNGFLGIGFIDQSENNTFENNQINNNGRLGIYLNSDSNRLIGNTLTGNSEGLLLDSCQNNSIVKNSVFENKKNGVWVYKSNGNTLNENSIRNNAANITPENDFYGLVIEASSGNLLKSNLLADNGYNFGLFGWEDQDFNNDIDTSNLINGKPILILRDVSNRVVDSSSSASTIYCLGCNKVTFKDLNLERQLAGIFLRKSQECKIENVRVSDNLIGIYGQFSSNNIVEGIIANNNRFGILLSPLKGCQNEICQANLIKGNSLAKNYYGLYYNTNETRVIGNTFAENGYGIWIQGPNGLIRNNAFSGNQTGIAAGDSKGSNIYNNNFLNNKVQVKFLKPDFSLSQLAPTGGNFWSEWSGPDNNNDGFVDFPYAVTAEVQDGLPWANESGWVPKTIANLSGIKGNQDWYLSDVTLSLTASDDEEVVKTEYSFNRENWEIYSEPVQIKTEGEKKIYYRSVDNDGNEEKINQLEVRIDRTPPMVSGKAIKAPNSSDWYKNDILVEFSASDQLSGIDKIPPAITLSQEGENQEVTGNAIDLAGNKATCTVREINIDKTLPQITINSPTEKGEYLLNQNLPVEWSITDELSGIATASGTDPSGKALNTQTVGKKIFKVFAKDRAGNEITRIANYTVKYNFLGFLPPTEDQEGYRLGSVIPIKFQLKDANGNFVTKATARLEIISEGGWERRATSVDQKNNSFRYDPSKDNYFFNLDTKRLTYGVWQLRVRLNDDSLQFTNFTLK